MYQNLSSVRGQPLSDRDWRGALHRLEKEERFGAISKVWRASTVGVIVRESAPLGGESRWVALLDPQIDRPKGELFWDDKETSIVAYDLGFLSDPSEAKKKLVSEILRGDADRGRMIVLEEITY